MEDRAIVKLFFERKEEAISETMKKYGTMLKRIAFSQTRSGEDAEECVMDTYLAIWNRIPPDSPGHLGSYAAKVVRRISLDKVDYNTAKKRGGFFPSDELTECIPSDFDLHAAVEEGEVREILNRFLSSKEKVSRVCFVKRYYLGQSIRDIADSVGKSEGGVKTLLYRMRAELKEILEKEGYGV